MHKFHKELLVLIKESANSKSTVSKHGLSYEGHTDKSYRLSNPQLRSLVRFWLSKHKDLDFDNFKETLNSLYSKGCTSTEKYVGGFLLEYQPKFRQQVKPNLLNNWLDSLVGWAQIDSLCQSRFNADDMTDDWDGWRVLLKKLNNSNKVNKRRASLVLLTKPVRDSWDKRFSSLAIQNIENIKHEKDILITKAISWLLREMTKNHKTLIGNYLRQNKDS